MQHQLRQCEGPPPRVAWIICFTMWVVACDGMTTEPQPATIRLVAATSTALSGIAGDVIEPAPGVRAVDFSGRGVAGVTVRFQVGEGHGQIARTAVQTDGDGLASVGWWELGGLFGFQSLMATAAEVTPVVFTAAVAPGPVASLTPVGGGGQTGLLDQPLLLELRVRVADAFGNPVAGAPVTFSVVTGGGSIADGSAVTDAQGHAASGVWTLGSAIGEQQARATTGTVETSFSAFAIPPVDTALRGRLAFVSVVDGNADIYTANPDGGGLQRLTTDPGRDLQPAWSPDGSRIAFAKDRVEGGDQVRRVYVMAADGTGVSRLTEGPFDADPSWSPDGSAIAFSSLRDGGVEIAALGLANGTVSVLTDFLGWEGHPSWSPDGRQIAFVSDFVAFDFAFDVYTMNADGSDRVLRTNGFRAPGGTRYYLHPTWSPDGSQIALVWGQPNATQTSMRFRIAVISPDGTSMRDLAWAGDIRWLEVLDPGSLSWSPDGRGIAFSFVDCDLMAGGTCSGRRSVRFVPLDGGPAFTLIRDAHSPSWR